MRKTVLPFAVHVMCHGRNGQSVVALDVGVGSAYGSKQCGCSTKPCATSPTKDGTEHVSPARGFQSEFRSNTSADDTTAIFVRINFARVGTKHNLRKSALATTSMRLGSACWLAVLHGLAIAIGILLVPMMLHTTEDELDICLKLALELDPFFVNGLYVSSIVTVSP